MFILTLFRLDQEVAFVSVCFDFMRCCRLTTVIDHLQIYPARWNGVKCAYIFCRYYPLAIAPFHFWGLIGNHEKAVCESYYHALYACTIPTVRSLLLPA